MEYKYISIVLTNYDDCLLSTIIVYNDKTIKCVNVDNCGKVFEWNDVTETFLDTYANNEEVFTVSETGKKITFKEFREFLNI